jgi:hypothetical protein
VRHSFMLPHSQSYQSIIRLAEPSISLIMAQERSLPYRHLNVSQNQIRLLSFESAPSRAPLRLSLSYVSLNDWKLEYLSFRDQKRPARSTSELCEAWKERSEFNLATPKHDICNDVARFNWGDYTCLSYAWGDHAGEKSTIFVNGIATGVRSGSAGRAIEL